MWHYVYLAATVDGVFYCGYAVDPITRVAAHNAGRGSKILRGKRPVTLAYVRRFRSRGNALRFEHALKARTHEYKKELSRRWLALKGTS